MKVSFAAMCVAMLVAVELGWLAVLVVIVHRLVS